MSDELPIFPACKGLPHMHVIPNDTSIGQSKYRIVTARNEADCPQCPPGTYSVISIDQQKTWLAEIKEGK